MPSAVYTILLFASLTTPTFLKFSPLPLPAMVGGFNIFAMLNAVCGNAASAFLCSSLLCIMYCVGDCNAVPAAPSAVAPGFDDSAARLEKNHNDNSAGSTGCCSGTRVLAS